MTLQEDFCSYETSKKLKELGFDMYYCMAWRWLDKNTQELMTRDQCTILSVYERYITDAPTLELANKWLCEKYGIEIAVIPVTKNTWKCCIFNLNTDIATEYNYAKTYYKTFDTKEDALRFSIDTIVDELSERGTFFKN